MMAQVTLTYFLDVLSSWCLIAEDALARVRQEFRDRIVYEWRIGALRDRLNYTPEQLGWYYKRTHFVTGTLLNNAWLEGTDDGPKWADLAAEAARSLGCVDDRVRLALARAAMIDGKHVGRREVAVETAARAGGIAGADLERAMDDPQTAARIRASSDEMASYRAQMRPTFVVRNPINDVAVLSGCWRYEPLAQAVRASLADIDAYTAFTSKNPGPLGVV